MNIREVAAQSGLPPKTIRYYESIGLIRPARSDNGYRVFTPSNVHTLTFIARSRSLGFAIEDCRILLDLYENKERASADVKDIAKAHLRTIREKLAELEAMQATLEHLVENCNGDDRPDCPIIDGLAQGRTAGFADAVD